MDPDEVRNDGNDLPEEQPPVTDASPVPDTPQTDYDYTIDPLVGLPKIEVPGAEAEEETYRIGRAPAPAEEPEPEADSVQYRATATDPFFGYIIAMAVSFGLMPLLPDGAPTRYTVAWGLLAGFGVIAWLLGNGERITQEKPENLIWGVVVGVIASTPLYLFGGATLSATANVLFDTLPAGALLAYLVFVMPVGETLFFRGLLQRGRSVVLVGVMATVWSGLLFFPLIRNINEFWGVAIFIGVTLLIVNIVYSWVRDRNGLAAAWLCQIVVNIVLIFLPFLNRGS